ncbi:MAG: peptidase M56, partial [Flavobacterium sp.]
METLFINLLKSSALIAAFYLAYHFLVRKETFFNSNRWFLLTGLFTALLLPWFNITKVVYVEKPKIALVDLVAYSSQNSTATPQVPVAEPFDWMSLVWIAYLAIALFLLARIVINFTSLFRMLHNQQKTKKEAFTLVDLNQNIAPFSFFNYIVYNSSLYTAEELQSILLHEKVHSREKHSFDVMVAK